MDTTDPNHHGWEVIVVAEIKYTARRPALVDESQFDVLMRLEEEKQEEFFFDKISAGTVASFTTKYYWNRTKLTFIPKYELVGAVVKVEPNAN